MDIVTQERGQEILRKFQQVETIRRPFESYWDVISQLFLPGRVGRTFNGSQYNMPYLDSIYDSTGAQAALHLTSTLLGGLANRNLKWFKICPDTMDITERDDDVIFELHRRTEFMLRLLGNPETKFYSTLAETTLETVTFGTSDLEVFYEPGTGVVYKANSLDGIYFSTDHNNLPDIVYHKYPVTARQVVGHYGYDNVSKRVQQQYDANPFEYIQVVRALSPNEDYAKGFTDRYILTDDVIEYDTGHLLESKKLDYMPHIIARWNKISGVDYGTSPAWTVMADVEMIQAMEATILGAGQKALDPPLLVSDDGVVPPIDINSGGFIPGGVDPLTGRPRIIPLVSGSQPAFGDEFIRRKKEAVKKAFFNLDLMQQDRPQMTAEEVMTLREEAARALSPNVMRFVDEVLYPILEKTYFLCLKHNLFPEVKKASVKKKLKDYKLTIEFDSPLANTAKMQDFLAFRRFMNDYLMPVAQVDPTALDILDPLHTGYLMADNLSVPNHVLAKPAEFKKKQQQRQQQLEAQFQAEVQNNAQKNQIELAKAQGGVPDLPNGGVL